MRRERVKLSEWNRRN